MFIPDKERLAILEQILNEFRGVNAAAQRRRFKAALLRLGSVLTFELSRFLDIYYPPARKQGGLTMTTLNVILLTLNFGVLILETRGIYVLLKLRKSKGHSERTLQPFKH